MLAPLFIVRDAILPHLVYSRISFIGLVKTGAKNGNAKHHKELVLNVFFKTWLLDLVDTEGFKASLRNKNLMRVSALHHVFLYGLIGSAYPIAIEIVGKVIHFIYL